MRLELFNYLTIIQSSRLGSPTIAPTDLTPIRMQADSNRPEQSSLRQKFQPPISNLKSQISNLKLTVPAPYEPATATQSKISNRLNPQRRVSLKSQISNLKSQIYPRRSVIFRKKLTQERFANGKVMVEKAPQVC